MREWNEGRKPRVTNLERLAVLTASRFPSPQVSVSARSERATGRLRTRSAGNSSLLLVAEATRTRRTRNEVQGLAGEARRGVGREAEEPSTGRPTGAGGWRRSGNGAHPQQERSDYWGCAKLSARHPTKLRTTPAAPSDADVGDVRRPSRPDALSRSPLPRLPFLPAVNGLLAFLGAGLRE